MKKGGKSARPVGVISSTKATRAELQNRGQSTQDLLFKAIEPPPLYPPLEVNAKKYNITEHVQDLIKIQDKIERNQKSSLYHVILNSLKNQDTEIITQTKSFKDMMMDKIIKNLTTVKGHLLPNEIENYTEHREMRRKRRLEKMEKEKELRKKKHLEEAQLIREESKQEIKKEAIVKKESSDEEEDIQDELYENESEELNPKEPPIDSSENDD